jgi:hypothetical protein
MYRLLHVHGRGRLRLPRRLWRVCSGPGRAGERVRPAAADTCVVFAQQQPVRVLWG